MPAATMAPAQPPVPQKDAGVGIRQGLPSSESAAGVDRMVVYNGTIRLEVADTEQTITKIEDILKANQGYIAKRSVDRNEKGHITGSIEIRVPSGGMQSTLAQIRTLGLKVLHEDGSSEDVTQEYVDLDARRKNLEAYEVELTKLLDTVRERTGKAEDILAVYNQLTEVRGQIEQIKGRQNYLQNTSSFATYTIVLVPHEEVTVVEEGWSANTTARTALRALVQALQGIADLGIYGALFLLPVAAVVAIPFVVLFLLLRFLFSRMRRRGARPAAA
jgi:hypothetical protein